MTIAFLYRWTEISTGKWYIGSRTRKGCHPNDGYICSAPKIKEKILANTSDWKREVLCIGEPKCVALFETQVLTMLDAKRDTMSYNQVNHWPLVGYIGIPSPLKGIKQGPRGPQKNPNLKKGIKIGPSPLKGTKKNIPSSLKGRKRPAISIAKKGKKILAMSIAKKGKPWSDARRLAQNRSK